jgi:hypothetical protein
MVFFPETTAMSASGHKAKSRADQRTSALAPKADISRLRVHALEKPGVLPRLFLFSFPGRAPQLRVRIRIMKVSNPSSATCIQARESLR